MKGIEIAKSKLGLQEQINKKELVKFFKENAQHNDIVINPSDTAWCAAFVNACEREAGNPGTGALNARSFLKYGKKIYDKTTNSGDVNDHEYGDIAVFERGNSTWEGHVTYIEDCEDDYLICVGGNQKDSVCREKFLINDKLLGVRRL